MGKPPPFLLCVRVGADPAVDRAAKAKAAPHCPCARCKRPCWVPPVVVGLAPDSRVVCRHCLKVLRDAISRVRREMLARN